jgi:ABC-2 type transport system ATP-binding protein
MDIALRVEGLKKTYKGFSLRDVAFNVPAGTIMGLIGPNGAGKTTLIKLILNLVRRESGNVSVFGLDNIKDEPSVKARIGFVYDAPPFPDDLTPVRLGSALAPFYPRWDAAQFRRLLGEFELPPRKRIKKLSHGMKQKLALALALSHDADLILMDEPTAGLDPVFRWELLTRLAAVIQDERKAVLFSTHITSDLEQIADYITFIREGSVVFSAPKDAILETWGLVKAGVRDLNASFVPALQGHRSGEMGFTALTSDLPEARRRLGERAIYDRATLEDIMYFVGREEARA